MTTEERILLLQSTPFFGATNERSVALLLGLSKTIHLSAGEFFFHQNDKGDSLFLLEKGRAEIFKTFNGIDYVLRTVNNGDCFGEMALIDFTPRSATVRAKTDCTAIEISSKALHSLYQQDCEQFLIVQMNVSREVSRRLRLSDERWFQSQVENNCTSSS